MSAENTERAKNTLARYAGAGHTGPVTFHFVQGGVRDVRETRESPSKYWHTKPTEAASQPGKGNPHEAQG